MGLFWSIVQGTVCHDGKVKVSGPQGSGTHSQEPEQCNHVLVSTLSIYIPGGGGMIPPTIRTGLPRSLNTMKIIPATKLAIGQLVTGTLAERRFLKLYAYLGPCNG